MPVLHITDIEAAINWWRERSPSPDGVTACAEVRALATVYALMVYYHETECDEATMPAQANAAWLAWYATTPDAPCIAICSTSPGRRGLQGLRPQLRRSPALDVDDAGRKTQHLAADHDGRFRLALQQIR